MMRFPVRLILVGLAALVAISAPAGAAGVASAVDALAAFDEFNIRNFIIVKCHRGQDATDQQFLAKEENVRRAALEQLWAQLDAADPSHHAENGKKAGDKLLRQRAARDFDIDEQIRNYGCAWLDGQLTSPPR
jgi:hypothetical protein